MPSSYFDTLPDWSSRKHAILVDYLPAFCRALSRQTYGSHIWYVDGYAGAGIYKNPADLNTKVHKGSPLLAAEITEKLDYPVRCLNVEADADHFASLQRATSAFEHVENMQADFTTVIDAVLEKVQGSPALFFLDPFGTKDLPMKGLIDRIVKRTRPTDILIRYDTEAVRRLAGNVEKDTKRGGANAINLDNWFCGDGWRTLLTQYSSGSARDDALLNYYLKQLIASSPGTIYACAYPIRKTAGHVKYHLVFATGNYLGMKVMSEILYKAEGQFQAEFIAYQEDRAGLYKQTDMFKNPVSDPSIETIRLIKEIILQIGRTGLQLNWTVDTLYRKLILDHGLFARCAERNVRASVKELASQGLIKRLTDGKSWGNDNPFRIKSDITP